MGLTKMYQARLEQRLRSPGPSITASAKFVKMKEDLQNQIETIHDKFETFMRCMKTCVVELTTEIDKLNDMVNADQPDRAPRQNVILFAGNGRKSKLLKVEQPAA
jgi:hypothetical protein